ncbi:MAG: sensor histidine kinase [Candidatus Promineifilaceae bacterium]|nr:sensor histidine kinase [Candidatus Promineifilaceae bacterium]
MDKQSATITDVWLRWDWLWTTIFYGAIAFSAVLTILEAQDRTTLGLILGITLLWVVWHALGLRLAYRNMEDWDARPWSRLVVIIGDIIFWTVLVNLSPNYYFALFGMFAQYFRHLPLRFAVPVTVIQVAVLSYLQLTEDGRVLSLGDPALWVFVSMGFAGIILGVWISAIIEQSMQRRELIEQLEEAQVQLSEAERREGMLEERQRLAREIHDTLAQGFTSIVMHLEAAEQALPDDLDVLQKHLDQARTAARTSLKQARRVVQDLRPELLEQQALPEAISRAAERWSKDSDIPVDVTVTGTCYDLHPQIEVALLRAAQEALNNVRKHAAAEEVSLTLSYMDDRIILDVNDDGTGIQGTGQAAFSGGYGLQAMNERVEQLGGEVIVESEPGEGTTLVVSIPVQPLEMVVEDGN